MSNTTLLKARRANKRSAKKPTPLERLDALTGKSTTTTRKATAKKSTARKTPAKKARAKSPVKRKTLVNKEPAKKKAVARKTTVKKKVGRPTIYTKKLINQICAQLSNGTSLRTVCRSEKMPCSTTVFRWLQESQEFREQYEIAKQESADAMAEDVMDIADDGTNDWMVKMDKDGKCIGWQLNGEHVQRSRLRVDTRKWLMSKMKPKKYGDKVTQEHTGDGGGPVRSEHGVITEDMDPKEAQRQFMIAAKAGTQRQIRRLIS